MYSLFSFSFGTFLAASTFAFVFYEVCWIVYCRTFHPLAKVPGPFVASFSRLWIWTNVRHGQIHEIQIQLHQKYGHLVRIAPNELACSDPSAIKEIYRNQKPLEKSDFYSTWTNTSFGKHKDNFSVTDETVHSERRRIVNHVYSMSSVLKSEAYIDDCCRLFIQQLGKFADNEQIVDLGNWLQMYTFDAIGELYFGRMFGFMRTGSDYQALIHSLDVLNPIMAGVAVSATYARPFILLSAVAFGSVRRALKALDHITASAKNCVAKRQQELESAKDDGTAPRRDVLLQLFEIMQERGEKVDFGIPDIQYEAFVALLAGSDTTAIVMRSVFYHLSRTPVVLAAVLQEIAVAFSVSVHSLTEPIKYADAIKLPLLSAAIKESMRLHPSVGFTMPRVSPSPDGIHINGVHIPPGYRVGINAHVVQRDKSIFGDDAETFRPQRWLADHNNADQLREMDRHMLNFGAGTRTCIGKNIALSEIHKLVPQILRNFDFIPIDPSTPWTTENYWFHKQVNLKFRLKRRVA